MNAKKTPRIELFHRHPDNPILNVNDWPYAANTVFNAAATSLDDETLLLVRVEDFCGISHLTAARSKNGIDDWKIDDKPTLSPDPERHPEELWGIEDPRITWLEELQEYVVTYTAYSQRGPLVSLATTSDFRSFTRIGPVMPPEDKDAALFPVRFRNQWAMLHRPMVRTLTTEGNIWLSFSPDLKHWGDHKEVIRARQGGWWDSSRVGLSPPPMKTPEGWLILYHGVRVTASGSTYRLGLALLDLEDPTRVLRRTDEWIFGPRAPYERQGEVGNVVFPCGWIENNGEVHMYYGSADSCICLATAKLDELVDFVLESVEKSPR